MKALLAAMVICLASVSSEKAENIAQQMDDDRFVIIDEATCHNGLTGYILSPHGSQEEVVKVLTWTGPEENTFCNVNLQPENLANFTSLVPSPKKKSVSEIMDDMAQKRPLSSFKYRILTTEEKVYLDLCVAAIVGLGKPENLLDHGEVESKARLMGASICRTHGREGMIYACESNMLYKPYIERAWGGICGWQA